MATGVSEQETEDYLLWVLSDSNLPTGTCLG